MLMFPSVKRLIVTEKDIFDSQIVSLCLVELWKNTTFLVFSWRLTWQLNTSLLNCLQTFRFNVHLKTTWTPVSLQIMIHTEIIHYVTIIIFCGTQ